MTRLSYKWTNGMVTKIFTSYDEVKQQVAKNGGSFTSVYEPIYEDTEFSGRHSRRAI